MLTEGCTEGLALGSTLVLGLEDAVIDGIMLTLG
jgi:hypothetical protein